MSLSAKYLAKAPLPNAESPCTDSGIQKCEIQQDSKPKIDSSREAEVRMKTAEYRVTLSMLCSSRTESK